MEFPEAVWEAERKTVPGGGSSTGKACSQGARGVLGEDDSGSWRGLAMWEEERGQGFDFGFCSVGVWLFDWRRKYSTVPAPHEQPRPYIARQLKRKQNDFEGKFE